MVMFIFHWYHECNLWLFPLGDYYRGPPGEPDQDPDEDWVQNLQEEGRAYQEWDEDADVDESGNAWFPFSKN